MSIGGSEILVEDQGVIDVEVLPGEIAARSPLERTAWRWPPLW
jgi:hypothetical protein